MTPSLELALFHGYSEQLFHNPLIQASFYLFSYGFPFVIWYKENIYYPFLQVPIIVYKMDY